MPPNPFAIRSSETSLTIVSNPAVAATCAIPEPMSPHPKTPTFLISIIAPEKFIYNCAVKSLQRSSTTDRILYATRYTHQPASDPTSADVVVHLRAAALP